MQWADIVKTPSDKMLRQFAGLFLVVFLGLAGWRWYQGNTGTWTTAIAVIAIVVGVVGMAVPAAVKPLYKGWMIAAFPIGWTISHLLLATMFYLIFTPLAWIFRLSGRDLLRLKRQSRTAFWVDKRQPAATGDYFRQF